MQLRERLGQEFDAVVTRILDEVYESDTFIVLVASSVSNCVGGKCLMSIRT
jgi:hypothetical protein